MAWHSSIESPLMSHLNEYLSEKRAAVLAPGERGGVRVGERIVVAGVHKLRAGEKIKAVERQLATER